MLTIHLMILLNTYVRKITTLWYYWNLPIALAIYGFIYLVLVINSYQFIHLNIKDLLQIYSFKNIYPIKLLRVFKKYEEHDEFNYKENWRRKIRRQWRMEIIKGKDMKAWKTILRQKSKPWILSKRMFNVCFCI